MTYKVPVYLVIYEQLPATMLPWVPRSRAIVPYGFAARYWMSYDGGTGCPVPFTKINAVSHT